MNWPKGWHILSHRVTSTIFYDRKYSEKNQMRLLGESCTLGTYCLEFLGQQFPLLLLRALVDAPEDFVSRSGLRTKPMLW
jgi:hypothetical protein